MSWAARHATERAKWLATSEHDMVAFLGPNSGEFRGVWTRARDKAAAGDAGRAWGWSWAGLIFGFAWFFYRKQWELGAVLLAAPVVLWILVPSSSAGGALALFSAIFGKGAIVQDGVTKVARIRAAGGGTDQIAATGGVSLAGGIVGGIVWTAALLSAIASRLIERG